MLVLSNWITIEPGKRGGKPCIPSLRITVWDVPGWLGAGTTEEQTTRCFVGFRNVGYVTHASDSPLTRKPGKYLSCGYASRISSVAIALRIIPAVSARC